MDIQRINPRKLWSDVVIHDGVAYLCGQVTKSLDLDIKGQTETMLEKVDALLEQAGSDRAHILSATIYLKDVADKQAVNEVWEAWVPQDRPPARLLVQAELGHPQFLVEISVIAAVV